MYSDRRGGGRGGRDGGYGGGGYGQRRDGGGYDQGYGDRRGGGRGGGGGGGWGGDSGGYTSEIYVDQRHVGRIIGKGGSRIRDLQDQSGANIKVTREEQDGKVRIVLSGGEDCCANAEDLIMKITEYDEYDDRQGGGRGGRGRGGGGGGWGGQRGGYDDRDGY